RRARPAPAKRGAGPLARREKGHAWRWSRSGWWDAGQATWVAKVEQRKPGAVVVLVDELGRALSRRQLCSRMLGGRRPRADEKGPSRPSSCTLEPRHGPIPTITPAARAACRP